MWWKMTFVFIGFGGAVALNMSPLSAADPDKTCDLGAEKIKWLSATEQFNKAYIALGRFKSEWSQIPWTAFAPEGAKSAEKPKAEALQQKLYKRIIEVDKEYNALLDEIIHNRLKACETCGLIRTFNSSVRKVTESKFENVDLSNLGENELRDQAISDKIAQVARLVDQWKADTDSYSRLQPRDPAAAQLQRYISSQAERIRGVLKEIGTLRKKYSSETEKGPRIDRFAQEYSCT
jgi:hypothetical protein